MERTEPDIYHPCKTVLIESGCSKIGLPFSGMMDQWQIAFLIVKVHLGFAIRYVLRHKAVGAVSFFTKPVIDPFSSMALLSRSLFIPHRNQMHFC